MYLWNESPDLQVDYFVDYYFVDLVVRIVVSSTTRDKFRLPSRNSFQG